MFNQFALKLETVNLGFHWLLTYYLKIFSSSWAEKTVIEKKKLIAKSMTDLFLKLSIHFCLSLNIY